MTPTISLFGTAVALAMPMMLGGVWVYWLLGRTERWNPALVIGHGYLVGLFAITLLIRIWDLMGLELNFWGISAVAMALTAFGYAMIRAKPVAARTKMTTAPIPVWQTAIIFALLALIAWRYSTILQELLLRPLYPWDAWMNWAPKAIVWFHYGELVPFADMNTWLAAPAEALTHIEGARNAWKYPVAVPLVQLWGMLGAGTSDHTVIYLPWMFIAIALCTALYGHLRLLGYSTLATVLAVYLLANLPFLNVHSALAGYADLWVAAVFGCGVFALKEWNFSRARSYAILALVMAVFCMQLKVPGTIMGGIIIALFALTLVPRGKFLNSCLFVSALLATYIFTVGISLTIPGVGNFVIGPDSIQIPYIGKFDLRYHDVNDAMIDTVFLMINWNLLWYLTVIALFAIAVRSRLQILDSFEIRAIAITLGFILFVYYFTSRYRFALDFTQVNRAIIYTVPVAVLLVASCFSRQHLRSGRTSGIDRQ